MAPTNSQPFGLTVTLYEDNAQQIAGLQKVVDQHRAKAEAYREELALAEEPQDIERHQHLNEVHEAEAEKFLADERSITVTLFSTEPFHSRR